MRIVRFLQGRSDAYIAQIEYVFLYIKICKSIKLFADRIRSLRGSDSTVVAANTFVLRAAEDHYVRLSIIVFIARYDLAQTRIVPVVSREKNISVGPGSLFK